MQQFVPIKVDDEGRRLAQRPMAPAGQRYAFRNVTHDGTRAVFELEATPTEAQCSAK